MNSLTVLGFEDYHGPAQGLAAALGASYVTVETHRFPDSECRVRVPQALPAHVVVCRSLDHPNDKLIELLLCVSAARAQGATRLCLVAPYLCYMRQDTAFRSGEAVSQRVIGDLLATQFDTVVTVDPHLHRVHALSEAIPTRRAIAVSAAAPLGAFLRERLQKPLLLGPDSESRQWVEAIANAASLDFAIAEKRRLGDRDVRIELPAVDLRDRHVVLVDDVASTGTTLAAAARQVLDIGACSVSVLVTHALCTEGTEELLRDAGVVEFWSTDSILHHSNAISLAPLLAEAVQAGLPASTS